MKTPPNPQRPNPKPADPLAWAKRLRRREHLCERLTKTQRAAWRVALKAEPEAK